VNAVERTRQLAASYRSMKSTQDIADALEGTLDELDQQRIRAEAAEAELESYRLTVTTGGPRPPVTQQWHNGASSRPSTAPAEGS
jgi:hypothetical protein